MTLVAPDGSTQSFSSQFADHQDVVKGPYQLAPQGENGDKTTQPVTGTYINTLLTTMGGLTDQVNFVSVDAGAVKVTLSRADVSKSDYQYPDGPPVLTVDGERMRLWVPYKGSQGTNVLNTDPGVPMVITLHDKGNPLAVKVAASTTSPKPGDAVHFTASATGADPGEALTYTWDFGDGAPVDTHDGAIDHTYSQQSSFDATVVVNGSGGSYGADTVRIVIGSPPQTGGDQTGGGTQNNGPSNGASNGGQVPTGGQTGGTGKAPSGKPSKGKDSGSKQPSKSSGTKKTPSKSSKTPTPTPTATATSSPSSSPSSSNGGSSSSSGSPPASTPASTDTPGPSKKSPKPSSSPDSATPTPSPSATPTATPSPVPTAAPVDPRRIAGLLLSTSSQPVQTVQEPPQTAAKPRPLASARVTGNGTPIGWLLGVVFAVGVAGAGAARESDSRFKLRLPKLRGKP